MSKEGLSRVSGCPGCGSSVSLFVQTNVYQTKHSLIRTWDGSANNNVCDPTESLVCSVVNKPVANKITTEASLSVPHSKHLILSVVSLSLSSLERT